MLMSTPVAVALVVLFAIHLIAFARLGLKRREAYYGALVVLFALLTASFGVRLLAPDAMIDTMGITIEVHRGLRMLAWVSAAVTLTWTALRLLRKRRS